jgi:undecaprenyl-diphosphatase
MRKPLVAIYSVLLAAFIALSLLAAQPDVTSGDRAVLDLVREVAGSPAQDVLRAVSATGATIPATITVSVIVILMAAFRRWAEALLCIVVPAITSAASSGLKALVDRARPVSGLDLSSASFPSGHTSYATALGGVIFVLAPRLLKNQALARTVQAVAVLYVVLTGLSRLSLAAHWPSDVVGGFLLGILLLVPAVTLYTNYVNSRRDVPEVKDA